MKNRWIQIYKLQETLPNVTASYHKNAFAFARLQFYFPCVVWRNVVSNFQTFLNCIKLSSVILFLVQQQFKKAVEEYANNRGWVVKPSTQGVPKVRGYIGIKLKRPRRQPPMEFGGRKMLERIHYYMSLNPKPDPPIEVSNLYVDSQKFRYISLL